MYSINCYVRTYVHNWYCFETVMNVPRVNSTQVCLLKSICWISICRCTKPVVVHSEHVVQTATTIQVVDKLGNRLNCTVNIGSCAGVCVVYSLLNVLYHTQHRRLCIIGFIYSMYGTVQKKTKHYRIKITC